MLDDLIVHHSVEGRNGRDHGATQKFGEIIVREVISRDTACLAKDQDTVPIVSIHANDSFSNRPTHEIPKLDRPISPDASLPRIANQLVELHQVLGTRESRVESGSWSHGDN